MVSLLRAAGIRADRGYPGRGMPYPDTPVVAVNLLKKTAQELTLAVRIYCSAEYSGTACEDLAMQIVPLLEGIGATCGVGECSFHSRSGLFYQQITAQWSTREQVLRVTVDGLALPYVTQVSAKRDVRVSMVGTDISRDDDGWSVTVTELLPAQSAPEADSAESFSLAVTRPGGTVRYDACQWATLYYEPTADGLLRRRVARCWGERSV